MLDWIKKHAVELTGTLSGGGVGVKLSMNEINLLGDAHAILLALFTGAAGGLGAIAVKHLVTFIKNKFFKK